MVEHAPIRIGILNDVPVALGRAGVDWMRAGLELALEEGRASGRVDRPVELVVRHAEGLPVGSAAEIEAAFADLRAGGVLAIVGPAITDNCLVARPLADAARLPILNWSGSEHSRGEYAFHYQLGSLPDEGPLIAGWLAEQGHTKVAVVRERSPIGAEYFEYFERAADRLGLEVVADLRCAVALADAAPVLERARAAAPEALVVFGLLNLPAVARARRALGWAVPVATNTALLFAYVFPELYWPLCEGWVYVDMVDEANPLQADLYSRLARRHGQPPAGPVAATGYDMGRLLVEGLALAPELTREGVRAGLERVKGLRAACGGAGTVMGFGPWDHAALKGPNFLVLRRVRDGGSHPLNP
jgi:ABC-type branched-subunit amino acid transport system substrate-binding protein